MTPEKKAIIGASLKGNTKLIESAKRVHAERIASGEDVKIREKIRATRIARGDWSEYDKSEWAAYRRRVRVITSKQPLQLLKNIEKRGRGKGKYHLDHVVSQKAGFDIGMPPEFIGNISNLAMITEQSNCSKQQHVDDFTLMALWFRLTKAIDP